MLSGGNLSPIILSLSVKVAVYWRWQTWPFAFCRLSAGSTVRVCRGNQDSANTRRDGGQHETGLPHPRELHMPARCWSELQSAQGHQGQLLCEIQGWWQEDSEKLRDPTSDHALSHLLLALNAWAHFLPLSKWLIPNETPAINMLSKDTPQRTEAAHFY